MFPNRNLTHVTMSINYLGNDDCSLVDKQCLNPKMIIKLRLRAVGFQGFGLHVYLDFGGG